MGKYEKTLELNSKIIESKGENGEAINSLLELVISDEFPLVSKEEFDKFYAELSENEENSAKIIGSPGQYPDAIFVIALIRSLIRNKEIDARQLIQSANFKLFTKKFEELLL